MLNAVQFILQEAFKAFHTDMKLVTKYMPVLEIGKLSSSSKSSEDEMKQDFAELKRKAEAMVITNLLCLSV